MGVCSFCHLGYRESIDDLGSSRSCVALRAVVHGFLLLAVPTVSHCSAAPQRHVRSGEPNSFTRIRRLDVIIPAYLQVP